jgi:uncharacterized protein (TIGR02001 family)
VLCNIFIINYTVIFYLVVFTVSFVVGMEAALSRLSFLLNFFLNYFWSLSTMKKSIVLATAVAAVLSSGVATADVTANAGVFSNYIWRGVSQTDDKAAGQGGIDYTHESGLYAGTWVSNVEGGTEVDLYGGFASEIIGISYDLGVITYQYPKTSNINFTEVTTKGSYTFDEVTVGVGAAFTVDHAAGNNGGVFNSGDMYFSGSVDFPLGATAISVYGGTYDFDNDGTNGNGKLNYSNYGTSISKDGFSLALDKNDVKDKSAIGLGNDKNNLRVTVSYSLDFDL